MDGNASGEYSEAHSTLFGDLSKRVFEIFLQIGKIPIPGVRM